MSDVTIYNNTSQTLQRSFYEYSPGTSEPSVEIPPGGSGGWGCQPEDYHQTMATYQIGDQGTIEINDSGALTVTVTGPYGLQKTSVEYRDIDPAQIELTLVPNG